MLRFLGIVFALMVMFAPGQAYAVCGSPTGNPGDIVYNQTEKIFQYCSDNVWKRMNAAPGSGSGGCTLPTLAEGGMVYNESQRVLQGCAGNVHRPFGPTGGVNAWKNISGFGMQACGIKDNGSLWCWGGNSSGQVGNGTISPSVIAPERESTNTTDWVRVSAGNGHTCAIKTNGSLWCWGSDTDGQLGNGATTGDQPNPGRESTNATDWVMVSAGLSHTCATKTNGSLWCWGAGSSGQIGNGGVSNQSSPVRESTNATDWVTVSAGGSHTCATKTNGSLWCWGMGASGQIGNGSTSNRLTPTRESTSATDWVTVSAGSNHTCATKTNSSLWCWGVGSFGALGNGSTSDRTTPIRESTNATNWRQVDTRSGSHTCATKTDGSLWCWGSNGTGSLGIGANSNNQTSPVREATNATDWRYVAISAGHSCAIKINGSLWCWGSDQDGRLGDGSVTGNQTTLVRESTNATDWLQLSAGGIHNCAIKTNRSLWCWGYDNNGQIGNGANTDLLSSPVRESTNATDWSQVSGGERHTCATKTNGALYCWGLDNGGQLGNGPTSTDQPSPVRESTNATDWIAVSAGGQHSCAIKTNGSLWCWGNGGSGQLGNGGTGSQNSPVRESTSATDWVRVSAGQYHTCAIKTNGSLWCWGYDNKGQLGNGPTSTNQPSPVRESTNATDWIKVSAGQYYTCAVKLDGSLWCWGNDDYGQLGNGPTSTDQASPVRESTNATDWSDVGAGVQHVCARKTTGSLWCWGRNDRGQLGIGNLNNQDNPTNTFAVNVNETSAGTYHTCNIVKNNQIWCMGADHFGTLARPQAFTPRPGAICGYINNIEFQGGSLLYNSSSNLLQYCDGVGWAGIGGGVAPPPKPEGIPTLGLAGYWSMNEGSGTAVADSSGNGNNGTIINGGTWAAGRYSNAFSSDGVNDSIQVAAGASALHLTSFTMSAWIRPNTVTGDQTIMNRQIDGMGADNFFLELNGSEIQSGYSSADVTWREITTSGAGIAINNWYHVAASFDNTSKAFRIYLNGSLVGSGTLNYTPLTTSGPFYISKPDMQNFNGLIDEVRIYNRALTVAEIQALAAQ